MNGLHEIVQPRPVVEAAAKEALAVRLVAGFSAIAGALPALALEFEWIDWTAGQVGAYGIFLGVVVGAVLLILGYQGRAAAIRVESLVTPVVSPRDDAGVPFVPIAMDAYED